MAFVYSVAALAPQLLLIGRPATALPRAGGNGVRDFFRKKQKMRQRSL